MGLALLTGLAALCAPLAATAQPWLGGPITPRFAADDLDSLALQGGVVRDRAVSVLERPHPEWDAQGLRFGGFVAYASFGLNVGGTDNVDASADGQADAVFRLRPALVLRSQQPDRRLTAFAVIDASAFARHGSESTTDYALGASGAVQSPRAIGLDAGAGFAHVTEPRTSSDSPQGALAPVQYDQAQGRLGIAAAFGRLRLAARAEVNDFTFDSVRAAAGASLPQSFRDRTETTATARGEWVLRPAGTVFVSGALLDRSYRTATAGRPDRSSGGVRLEVGSSFDTARLIRGEVAVGYLDQDYGGRYPRVAGASARARLEAFPTPLTTVAITAARAVEDAVIPSTGGYLASTAKAEVHHELLRNLLLDASAAYEADDYRGADREDRRTLWSTGLRYLANRGMVVTARLERETRRSGGAQRGLPYTVDRATLGLTLRC